VPVSTSAAMGLTDGYGGSYPPAIAALEAEVTLRSAKLEEATAQCARLRLLFAQGIVAQSELEAAETLAVTLAADLAAARQRLQAAVVEHQRKYSSVSTEMALSRLDLGGERLQAEKLTSELKSVQAIIGTLEQRRELLERKRAQLVLVTPVAGRVFGEDLPRSLGQQFQKGAEICRVAQTQNMLVRVQVPEREIGDVQPGFPVRLKVRSIPDRVFRGVVSRIGGESETDQYNQPSYRVELTIDNSDGQLRPGMTAFARIDYGRRMIGAILLHKIRQTLRPELWML